MIELLAGAPSTEDAEARQHVTEDLERILDAQRIISLDTLFQLADHIEGVAKGVKLNTALIAKLTGQISEVQLPRATLSASEKNAMGFGYWTDRHIDAERRLNLRAAIEKAAGDPEKIREDTRPAGASCSAIPCSVSTTPTMRRPERRSCSPTRCLCAATIFWVCRGSRAVWHATETFGTGWPSNAGGRLVGSLSSLPYALAEAEQNFLVPAQTQALIWGDLVPQMILSAKIPRWWNVTPTEIHWVGLHLRYGRELLAESAFDSSVRAQTLSDLGTLANPARTAAIGRLLSAGEVKEAADRATPSELFLLARAASQRGKDDWSCLASEIREVAADSPAQANYQTISRAFGTPKPTLANSYQPELLNLRTFPALMGYSSRIMAESWESNTLYWAALADELSLPPAELNVRIPEWTQQLVERIFASHLEDWPALLKSLRSVGDDVRAHSRAAMAADHASLAGIPKPVKTNDHFTTRIIRTGGWRVAQGPGGRQGGVPRKSGYGGP